MLFEDIALVSWGFCNKALQTGSLQQQQCILSQFWRLEAQNQGVGGAVVLLEALGKNPSSPLPGFWQLLSAPGIPWTVATLPQSLPLSPHSLLPVCVCVSPPSPRVRIPAIGFMFHLVQYDLILMWWHLQRSLFHRFHMISPYGITIREAEFLRGISGFPKTQKLKQLGLTKYSQSALHGFKCWDYSGEKDRQSPLW